MRLWYFCLNPCLPLPLTVRFLPNFILFKFQFYYTIYDESFPAKTTCNQHHPQKITSDREVRWWKVETHVSIHVNGQFLPYMVLFSVRNINKLIERHAESKIRSTYRFYGADSVAYASRTWSTPSFQLNWEIFRPVSISLRMTWAFRATELPPRAELFEMSLLIITPFHLNLREPFAVKVTEICRWPNNNDHSAFYK